jgi:hypothetical protein
LTVTADRTTRQWRATMILSAIQTFTYSSARDILNIYVKRTLYRPGHVQRVPEGWSSQISIQLAHEITRILYLRTGRLYPSKIIISVIGWVYPRTVVRPEGLCQWKKIIMTRGLMDFRAEPESIAPTSCPIFDLCRCKNVQSYSSYCVRLVQTSFHVYVWLYGNLAGDLKCLFVKVPPICCNLHNIESRAAGT